MLGFTKAMTKDEQLATFIDAISRFANKHPKRVVKMSLATHNFCLERQIFSLLPANVHAINGYNWIHPDMV